MFTVTVKSKTKTDCKEYSSKILLSDALHDMGYKLFMPCGGKGMCGKCTVYAEGILYPQNEGYIPACKTYAIGDVTVTLNDIPEILSEITGKMPHFVLKPIIKKGLCAAVDIGTTTIASYIYSFPEGKCIDKLSATNPQIQHGSDVISRINYAGKSKKNLKELSDLICHAINTLTQKYDIDCYVIGGNTAMLHFLTETDITGLSEAPFSPKTLFGIFDNKKYIMKCISAFVGADITAGILACGMAGKDNSILIDIGTNGEIVLNSKGDLICVSTAAGPAFEAVGMSCGVPAISGAINKVYHVGNKIFYDTINNALPIGMCGSGVIDLIACLIEIGEIDSSGRMDADFCLPDSKIKLTPDDVRQFQLAKSAVRAGVDTLLCKYGVCYNDISTLFLSGGFGSNIDAKKAVITGLIPRELLPKIEVIGNSCAVGASMLILNSDFIELSEQIACRAKTIPLAGDKLFADKFMSSMIF